MLSIGWSGQLDQLLLRLAGRYLAAMEMSQMTLSTYWPITECVSCVELKSRRMELLTLQGILKCECVRVHLVKQIAFYILSAN